MAMGQGTGRQLSVNVDWRAFPISLGSVKPKDFYMSLREDRAL